MPGLNCFDVPPGREQRSERLFAKGHRLEQVKRVVAFSQPASGRCSVGAEVALSSSTKRWSCSSVGCDSRYGGNAEGGSDSLDRDANETCDHRPLAFHMASETFTRDHVVDRSVDVADPDPVVGPRLRASWRTNASFAFHPKRSVSPSVAFSLGRTSGKQNAGLRTACPTRSSTGPFFSSQGSIIGKSSSVHGS